MRRKRRRTFLYPFFLKVLAGTCPFWGDYWYPCFGFLVMSRLGFIARVGSALFAFCGCECNVHFLRPTSGATHVNFLAAGNTACHFQHASVEVGLISDSNGHSPGQKINVLPFCQRPGLKKLSYCIEVNKLSEISSRSIHFCAQA